MLFLVEGTIGTHPYMGKSSFRNITHIVEASTAEEAMEKFNSQLSKSRPYGTEIVATAEFASKVIS